MTTFQLESRGFAIEHLGFEFEEVPLYAHVAKGDKLVGARVAKRRVVNKSKLTDEEKAYFQRKAAAGLFPWEPGEECMRHTFKDLVVEVVDGKRVRTVSEPYQGCKWCQERPDDGFESGDGIETKASFASVREPSHPDRKIDLAVPAPAAKAYPCPLCKWGANTELGFKIHYAKEHASTPVKSGRTRKGAGKEKT